MLKIREDFLNLKLGQKIYTFKDNDNHPIGYYYAGFSPVSDASENKNYVMLVCDSDVSKMITIHLSQLKRYAKGYGWFDSYDECKLSMLKHIIEQIKSFKNTYFRDWGESDWRNFNLQNILEEEAIDD